MKLFSKPETSEETDSPNDDPDAPWIKATSQHENTFLRLSAHAANWRKLAFSQEGVIALLVGGCIYLGSQPKHIPYLVEVDSLGRTVAVRALTGEDAVKDTNRLVYREIFDLIENLRTVTTDRNANNDRLNKAFSRLSGAALAYVKSELKKAPPNQVGQTKTIQVKVKTALRLTDKTWQVEWEEDSYNLAGEFLGKENWKATLQYELKPSGNEREIRQNPIGFTVTELHWMKVI